MPTIVVASTLSTACIAVLVLLGIVILLAPVWRRGSSDSSKRTWPPTSKE